MEPQAKKKSKLPLILIGCGGLMLVLVVIGGILAAIAIPAFVRYTTKAKAIEAEFNVTTIANQAAAYYTRECAFPPTTTPSSAVPTGGDKLPASFSGPGWDELAVPLIQNELYFAYRAENQGETMLVVGESDFKSGGAKHTVTSIVNGTKLQDSNCSAEVGQLLTKNELE